MARENGYYWVRFTDQSPWSIAYWALGMWVSGVVIVHPVEIDERRIVRDESSHVASDDTGLTQQLVDELAALQSNLGLLESEICNADLRLAEMESSQRELLRRRECAGERVRIVFAKIQEVESRINAIKASKDGTQ